MARFVPVPGHAAVAHLSARPLTPVLGTLPPQDMEVLRCAGLDARLLVNILGNLRPADTLRSAEGRRLPYLVTRRGRLPHCDTTVIGGITCATIARAAVDIARLGTPVQAVQAILTARNHGVSRVRLLLTLNHCRGAASRGCPRAQHIIESAAFHQ